MEQILFSINLRDFENLQRQWMREEAAKAIEAALPKIQGEFSDLPELVTRRQAAKMLSVSLGTLDTWAKDGRLDKVRAKGIVRFKKAELLANFKSLKESRYQRL
jgi:excisionase family DNA binding protein